MTLVPRIRPARSEDREFLLALIPLLTDYPAAPWRDRRQMVDRDRDVLMAALEQRLPQSVLFVAEDETGKPVGFVHLTTDDDYYSNAASAHVGDVVVAEEAQGQGVGGALLAYAESWARERGVALLTLNVFTSNRRARDLYTKLGYTEEWIRCIKRLKPPE